MVSGALLSHWSMPVNSGAAMLLPSAPADAAVEMPAASVTMPTKVLNRKNMRIPLKRSGREQRRKPGSNQDVVLQVNRQRRQHHQHAEQLLQALRVTRHRTHMTADVLAAVEDGQHGD